MKTGIELITVERQRQIDQENWTAEHDDEHEGNELAYAAGSYLLDFIEPKGDHYKLWPWDRQYFKPTPEDPIRQLTKAGALIAAEIDHLQRQQRRIKEGLNLY